MKMNAIIVENIIGRRVFKEPCRVAIDKIMAGIIATRIRVMDFLM